jgi:hypothetical protein
VIKGGSKLFIGVLKKWENVTHLLNRKEFYYRILAATIVVIYGFLLSSRFLIHLPNDLEDTPLRKQVTNDTITAQMTEKTFFTDRNMLQVGLIFDDQSVTIPRGYAVAVREKSNTKANYKTQLIKITDAYYLLFVHRLPTNWQSVSIQISEIGNSDSTFSTDQKLYVANPKTIKVGHFRQQSSSYYANQYYELLIKDDQKSIAREYQKQNSYQSDIRDIENKISSLKDELTYQTGSQKQDTQNEILNQQTQMNGLKTNIQNSQDQVSEDRTEIQLLKKKQAEIGY